MIFLPVNVNNKGNKWYIIDKFAILLAPLSTCLIYLLTLAPGLSWSHWGADGGDFLAATASHSLPHPPGFPLYLLIARMISFFPLKGIAFRMNLLSAVMAVGAVFFSAMTLRELELTLWSRIAAPLSLGLAPLFWSQALITEVYTSVAFFVSLGRYLSARTMKRETAFTPSGVVWGFALAVHPIAVFSALDIWFARKKIRNGIIAGVLIAALFYGSLVISNIKLHRWADFRSVTGWFEYVSGRLYWDYAFNLPLKNLPRRIMTWVTLYSRQFTPIGSVLVVIGMYEISRKSLKTAAGFILTISTLTLYAITYNSTDSFIYLVPFLPLFIPFLGQGMDWLIKQDIPGIILLMIPVFLVVSHWQSMSLHNDITVDIWLKRIDNQTPLGSVLITSSDEHTFALWYAQEVSGFREDVLVLDERLWVYPPYQRFIAERVGQPFMNFTVLGETRTLCFVHDKEVVCQ